MCTTLVDESIERELQTLEQRMDAYEKGEVQTIPQEEVFHCVMASI